MKRHIILIFVVALMCSCNGDIYDNIKEMVDKETVYPAGYDPRYVKVAGGLERVEIDLCEKRFSESELYLPKAVRTVVEYNGKKDVFEPARSWVNITGLTVPQMYRFKIYTEDEFGNASRPVEITGKPFTEADKGRLTIAGLSFTANTTQAVVTWNTAPDIYIVTEVEYSYTDPNNVVQRGNIKGNRIVFNDLPVDGTTPVNLSFKVLPAGAIDTVSLSGYNIKIKTMTVEALNAYINLTQRFPLGATDKVTSATPYIIKAADFDLGGQDKGYHKASYTNTNIGDWLYRVNGGDLNLGYGIDVSASPAGLMGIGWASIGDWYAYTIDVQDPGLYKIEYSRAMNQNGGQASLTLDALDILGIIPIISNGSWFDYVWNDPNVSIKLSAGKHKFRWTHRGAPHNFGGLRLTFVP